MPDLVGSAVLQRQLEGVAEEMGAVLVRSALSSNIKERQDSSTALFDPAGTLLAQAAHIPVHLGSMQHAVAAVLAHTPQPGDAWLLNDPYAGGTHLPDITLVCALADADGIPLGLAAVRAHHADVGGTVPGSMSAAAASIDAEGVRVPPTLVARGGELLVEVLAPIVGAMRQPDERLGDLRAQLAALRVAKRRMPRLAAQRGGPERFLAACGTLIDDAERRARNLLAAHAGGWGEAERIVELPAGAQALVRAAISVDGGTLRVDLRASSPQTATSLNCPRSVTDAAVLFATRVALGSAMPGGGGAARAIEVVTTPGSIVHALAPAAVAAGNVEISSVVADVVLAALGAIAEVPADGQGTMNNLVIGNESFSYYETIAGGQGAAAHADGPDAVQVAMTNTRNTPIEALELEFPLEVVQYAVRRGSGGAGLHRGGDGVIRAVRVLEACSLNIIAQRRLHAPHGRAGGADGAVGQQFVNGEPTPGLASLQLEAGDIVEIRTPGGGGYGVSGSDAAHPTV